LKKQTLLNNDTPAIGWSKSSSRQVSYSCGRQCHKGRERAIVMQAIQLS